MSKLNLYSFAISFLIPVPNDCFTLNCFMQLGIRKRNAKQGNLKSLRPYPRETLSGSSWGPIEDGQYCRWFVRIDSILFT